MRHLHEEIQQHIHDKLCQEVNEFIIACKLHHMDFGEEVLSDEGTIQQAKIREARKRRPEPGWDDVIQLLTEVRDEMNKCKQPYRRY